MYFEPWGNSSHMLGGPGPNPSVAGASCLGLREGCLLGKGIPSLKLTAKAPKNGGFQ